MSTAKVQSFKNGLLYIIPFLVGSVLPIITLPVFTRFLTVEDYGIYALTIVYGVFVSGIANFGLTIGYERNFFNFSGDKEKAAALLFSTLSFVIASTLILGIITFFFKEELAKLIVGSESHGNLLVWAFFASSITSLKVYFLTYFKNSENAKSFVWYSIDENLLNVVFSLFFVVFMKSGVLGLLLGQLIAGSIIFLLLIYKFIRMLPFVFSVSLLQDSLRLSIPLTPRIFFGIIGSQFDKYMIGLLNTVGGVGVYNLGQKIANIVFTFMTAIQNVYAPQVYKRMFEMDEKAGGESIGKYLTPFLFLSIFAALLVSIFAEEVITILTPNSYHSAIDVVIILSMLFASYFFGKQPQLIYAKKTMLTSWLTLTSIGLNIAINIPFIYYFGVIGAAWGTLTAGLISGAISFVISQRYYEIKWEYGKILTIYLSYFTFAILTISLRNYQIPYELRFGIKILCVIYFLYLAKKFSYLTKANFMMVKGIVRPSRKVPEAV
jgi:O-antigen/teichoic acid export membrane protein